MKNIQDITQFRFSYFFVPKISYSFLSKVSLFLSFFYLKIGHLQFATTVNYRNVFCLGQANINSSYQLYARQRPILQAQKQAFSKCQAPTLQCCFLCHTPLRRHTFPPFFLQQKLLFVKRLIKILCLIPSQYLYQLYLIEQPKNKCIMHLNS